MIKTLLIANRGEIARRVMRTAQRLGIRTIAVYSEADAQAGFVHAADEAYAIGPAPAAQSYLQGDVVLAVAQKAGAQAIHPGYGFLSENADFAEKVTKAGLVFVGPSASAMRAMGGKSAAKALMEKAGVPLLPGYHGDAQEDAVFIKAAEKIGYPLMIKASAGGGGKGMRIVERAADLPASLQAARSEAEKSFADGRLLLEKYVRQARHVEVQILADAHGTVLALGDRDCSIQRRHQKIVEEAPAPDLPDALRQALHKAAIAAAKAVGYVNAGTIEFLVEVENGIATNGYFMEMNTRLQVEHPVTEAIFGLDLVEWQLRIASGEALPPEVQALKPQGHAIEVRLCAEDPSQEFLPSTGTVSHLHFDPAARVDTDIVAGTVISRFYDSLLAKIIVHGDNRAQAVAKLAQALQHTRLEGLQTNRHLLWRIAQHPAFARAAIDTAFLTTHRDSLWPKAEPASKAYPALVHYLQQQAQQIFGASCGWRCGTDATLFLPLATGDMPSFNLAAKADYDAVYALGDDVFAVYLAGVRHEIALANINTISNSKAAGDTHIRTPMPGLVTQVFVAVGQSVPMGAPLFTLEAMKMLHTVKAPFAAIIEQMPLKAGQQIAGGVLAVQLQRQDN